MTAQRKVRTCFWFTRRGIDAAQFYVSLLPDSRIDAVFDYGRPDDPMIVEFTLADAPMMILTGGVMFEHSPAASISVLTKDQAETDRLWSALLADGGKESMCEVRRLLADRAGSAAAAVQRSGHRCCIPRADGHDEDKEDRHRGAGNSLPFSVKEKDIGHWCTNRFCQLSRPKLGW